MKYLKKFFSVGLIATTIDYLTYSLFVFYKLASLEIAIVIGYSAGFFVSFFLTRKFVFEQIKINNIYIEFITVLSVTLIGLIMNIVIVDFLISFSLNSYIARLIAIVIVFFFNFYARKGFIYG